MAKDIHPSSELHPDNINAVRGRKFSDMNGSEKLVYLGKVIVFIVSFGFAFPTLFSD